MRRSAIDRRAKRYAPRQCVADVGGHKDAPCPAAGRADVWCHAGKIWRVPVAPGTPPQCEAIGECMECRKATKHAAEGKTP